MWTILTRDDFLPVTLDDKEFFQRYYARNQPQHSDNSFTNMVCWNDYAHYEYAITGKSLVIASTIYGSTSFRAPAGPKNDDVLREVLHLSREEGGENAFYVFTETAKEWIQKRYPSLTLYPDRDFFDYVYHTADLACLPGKKYLSIRRHINRFQKNCDFVVEFITPENIDEVIEFLDKWCEWKHCEDNPILSNEKEAFLFAIRHFFVLNLSGLIIKVDGIVSAISIFEELNKQTALVHFEKGLPDCEGIYKQINQETAKYLYDHYRYTNRESDLGVRGLREAKLRYHPDHFVKVYYAKKSEI